MVSIYYRKALRYEERMTKGSRRYREPTEPEMEDMVQNTQFTKFASLYFKDCKIINLKQKICRKPDSQAKLLPF
jgi:hypothetical protein